MNRRAFLLALGCGVTAFAIVFGAITTVIEVETVAILLGVPAGGMAAVLTMLAIMMQFDRLRPRQYWLATGAAGFGYALAGLVTVTALVGSPGTPVVVALALLVGLAAGGREWRQDQ